MNNFTAERNNCRRRLILLVKQHPILWNKTAENYNRNRPQKLQTWQEIAELLGLSVDKIRRTWENLRDQYRRDLKRELKYGFKSKWRFFGDMDFIRDMVACKGQVNEGSDSDSEMEPHEMHQFSKYVFENDTDYPEASDMPSTSNAAMNASGQNDNFQPIILSKQWQIPNQTENQMTTPIQAIAGQITRSPEKSQRVSQNDAVEVVESCDSSRSYRQSGGMPNPMVLMEMMAKREPEAERVVERERRVSLVATPPRQCMQSPAINQNRQFTSPQYSRHFPQESLVSTSDIRRFENPPESPQRNVNVPPVVISPSNNGLPNSMELMEMLAKREPQNDSDFEIEAVTISPSRQQTPALPRQFHQEPQVSTSSARSNGGTPGEDAAVETPRSSSAPKRKRSIESADLETKDEDYYFVMSLLPSIRQIPRNRKFALRIGIMNLIAKDLEEVCK
ncbi:uncharacterized protein LOC131803098 [Musca domestica]|uniref:Uncharacterized protein LOC105262112 n=1 Tax=Musca domestica TaxID=7370 RepID=A0A9J7D9Z9_MUSDO|nr:uncharacterized protein LOC105262112 [Musca domestica]XP_058980100.1 uncharacterized protein LOC131803098 [Musca domestica]